MENLKWIPDCVQSSLVNLIKKLHSDFGVPLTIHNNKYNSLYSSIQTQTPMELCPANWREDTYKIGYTTCDAERIDIATSNLVLRIPERVFEMARSHYAIEEAMISPINLKDLHVQLINTNKSMLFIGGSRIEKNPIGLEVIISTRIGLGISYKLKERVQSHCRQKCNKFMRCILKPEKCNLAFIMGALK